MTSDVCDSVCVLFFCSPTQAITLVFLPKFGQPRGQEYLSRSLNLDWSFGMCLTKDLTAVHRLAWAYVTPVYLLLLVGLSYFLSHFRRLVTIFGRYSVLRMFWQFTLLSFSSLATTSFQLLTCVTLDRKEDFEDLYGPNAHIRFAHDASLKCFGKEHLPWGVVASVVVGLVCIPLPLFLPFLHRSRRFMPLYDVYSSVYKDRFRWWASFDLLRRLLFAVIYATVQDPAIQHLAFNFACIVVLAIHIIIMPFKSQVCNYIENGFLLSLTCIAILSGPDTTWSRALAIQVLFAIPVVALAISWAVHHVLTPGPRLAVYLEYLKRRTRLETGRSCRWREGSSGNNSTSLNLSEGLLQSSEPL